MLALLLINWNKRESNPRLLPTSLTSLLEFPVCHCPQLLLVMAAEGWPPNPPEEDVEAAVLEAKGKK